MTPQIQNNAAQAAVQDLEYVVQQLRQAGRVVDEEGELTDRLDALLSKLRAPVADEPCKRCGGPGWYTSHSTGYPESIPCSACNPQGVSVERLAKDPFLAAQLWRKPVADGSALASAPIDPETAQVDFLVRLFEELDTWRAEDWNELIERRPAILALLRPLVLASAPVAGEAQADQFIQAAIDRAPEPLRRLGEYLSRVLDEDQWATAERMLLGACNAAPQASANDFAKLQSAYTAACDQIGELLAEKQASANAAGEALVWRVSWLGGRRPTDWRDFATNPPPSAEYLARAGYTIQVAYAAPQAARAKASPEDLP